MSANILLLEYKTTPNKKSSAENPLPPWAMYGYMDLQTGFSFTNLLSAKTEDMPHSVSCPCFAEASVAPKPGRDGIQMVIEEISSVSEKIRPAKIFREIVRQQVMLDTKTGEIVE